MNIKIRLEFSSWPSLQRKFFIKEGLPLLTNFLVIKKNNHCTAGRWDDMKRRILWRPEESQAIMTGWEPYVGYFYPLPVPLCSPSLLWRRESCEGRRSLRQWRRISVRLRPLRQRSVTNNIYVSFLVLVQKNLRRTKLQYTSEDDCPPAIFWKFLNFKTWKFPPFFRAEHRGDL